MRARLKSLIFRVARGLEKVVNDDNKEERKRETEKERERKGGEQRGEPGRVSATSVRPDNEEGTEDMPREKTSSRRRHYP